MNKERIDALVKKYEKYFNPLSYQNHFPDTQYDDRSAQINYAMVREYKPKVVVEFGSRKGRCTRDILQALIDNGGEYTFKSYEVEDGARASAQQGLNEEFGDKAITIGHDIRNEEVPGNIEYLFVDHSHEVDISEWTFDYLIPNKCKPGCIIQIHDLPISGDWEIRDNPWKEAEMLRDRIKSGYPLKKIYWTFEEGDRWESTWWQYR